MAIVRIEQIYLYTDYIADFVELKDSEGNYVLDSRGRIQYTEKVPENTDSGKAIKWLRDNGIADYINLNYNDPAVHQDCFDPLNSWHFENKSQEISSFPFLYYTEVHDDLPVNQMPMVLLYGLDEIVNSNLVELYQLGK